MSTTQKAIVIIEKGKVAIQDVPIVRLRDDGGEDDERVLVRVKAVAINPTDWKHIHNAGVLHNDIAGPGCRSGCDYAGVVEAVGRKVTKFRKGDRIAGFVHGANTVNHESGAFQEYVVARPHVALKIPDNLSFEEAATLGVSVTTCGQGLYKALKLPLPTEPATEPFPVLIHGGSTATGVFGIQYAKASGLTVVATSSPHNFAYLKSLGADAVFDYRSPTCAADIKAFVIASSSPDTKIPIPIRHAWDCAGGSAGVRMCAATLADDDEGADFAAILSMGPEDLRAANPRVRGPLITLAYDALGDAYRFWNGTVPVKPDEVAWAARFWDLSERMLAEGKLRTVTPIVNRGGEGRGEVGGLEGVLAGLEESRLGRVSGGKLVYTL
ncbi:putative alcohol dehydrogenase [Xylariomycetidae sp. FL2044]|nr:putative alcohol dehydrogenase [Xylariomycetidae sp. FL2044]